MKIPFLSRQLFSSPGKERERGAANTAIVMQQVTRAPVTL
jgi:hypothetical protein